MADQLVVAVAGTVHEEEPAVDILGLAHTVLLTDSLAHAGLRFIVREVVVRQAPAMVELIEKAVRVPPGWLVPRTRKLRHVARIANEVQMVISGVVPLLLANHVDPTGARLLRRYTWSINHSARKVDGARILHGVRIGDDGPFYSTAVDAANTLMHYADHVLRPKRSRSAHWFAEKVTELIPAVTPLLDYVVNIPRGGPLDAAAPAEDDDELE